MKAKKEVTVREATGKDSDGIVKVLAAMKLDGETWEGEEAFVAGSPSSAMQKGEFIVLVAEYKSSIVGFVDCAVFPSFWEGEKQGLIVDFFVHPKYQGKGAGSKLLSALIERAEKGNIGELHVSTERNNTQARKIYAKFGFTEERLLLERSRTKG